MDSFFKDLRYAGRVLAKEPGFAAVIVLALALGIGATTAIFTVVDGVVLRPLSYKDPDRLAMIWTDNTKTGTATDFISPDNFQDVRAQAASFESMAAVSPKWNFVLTQAGAAEHLEGLYASAELFPTLGAEPMLGRVYSPEQDRAGAEPVVVLGYGLWQRMFGGDPNIVGKPITLDGTPFEVVGVMPAGFEFLGSADMWVPLSQNPIIGRGRGVRFLSVVGRLAPGTTVEAAHSDVVRIAQGLAEAYPDANSGLGLNLVPLHEQVVGKVQPAFLVLLAAVCLVVLIACANVANLLLARATARQREIAVRLAVGASRSRVVRQLLVESMVLAVLGGLGGLLYAVWGVDLLLALAPENLPRRAEIGIDARVLAVSAIVTISTGLIFGLAPALHGTSLDLNSALKEEERGVGAKGRRLRSLLVVTEIAIALSLLIGSGLLARSFIQVLNEDAGFDSDHVLTVSMLLPMPKYAQPEARRAFWGRIESELGSLPGVESVGAVTRLPLLSPDSNITSSLTVDGQPRAEGDNPEVDYRRASTGYFKAMGIPVLEGRSLTDEDATSSAPVVVVNQALAERTWPGESALGKRIKLGPNVENSPWITIVGVVGNVRHIALDTAPRPEVYLHLYTSPASAPIVVIKAKGDPAALASVVRERIRASEPDVPLYNIKTMGDLAARSVAQRKFSVVLLGAFAVVAGLLAVVGLYGVMSFLVVRQTREIGIRVALGAVSGDVVWFVVRRAMQMALWGVAVGLVLSAALSRFIASLLYGLGPMDPGTYVSMAVLLIATALGASLAPAWRASRIDPSIALRYE